MDKKSRFSPEVRERAVERVLTTQGQHESQWAAIQSVAEQIGCAAETLRQWVRQAERSEVDRPRPAAVAPPRLPRVDGGNEILRRVLAHFDRAELHRLSK